MNQIKGAKNTSILFYFLIIVLLVWVEIDQIKVWLNYCPLTQTEYNK